jgi:hypothetical protein
MPVETSPALKALQRRRETLDRERNEIDLLMRIASSGHGTVLPVPHEGLSHHEALEIISHAIAFWDGNDAERMEFLLRHALHGPQERQRLNALLKAWISLLSRRQKRLSKRISRKGSDAGALALRLAARPVISRLIEIRRETKRVTRLTAEIRTN